jgi:cell filamentation protein
MYDAVADDYCCPGTTFLKNKLNLTDAAELAAFEAEVSDARADEEAPAGDLDYVHFKAIHHHLFQDVYDWAGEARTVPMSKDNSMFCFPENIDTEATKLFAKLKTDKFMQGLAPKDFAKRAAHFLAESNAIYAFREGNGRAQLSFFLLLAEQAGHPLDFDNFDPDAFLEAMIVSFGGNEAPLANLVEDLFAE